MSAFGRNLKPLSNMEIDVSLVKFNDVEYEILRGGDVISDGMYLEASISRPGARDQALETFYSDVFLFRYKGQLHDFVL
jgi:hypothetical protein